MFVSQVANSDHDFSGIHMSFKKTKPLKQKLQDHDASQRRASRLKQAKNKLKDHQASQGWASTSWSKPRTGFKIMKQDKDWLQDHEASQGQASGSWSTTRTRFKIMKPAMDKPQATLCYDRRSHRAVPRLLWCLELRRGWVEVCCRLQQLSLHSWTWADCGSRGDPAARSLLWHPRWTYTHARYR